MGKFARSWALTKESWAVLRSDKTLAIFPVLSTVALLLVTASFAVPAVALYLMIFGEQAAGAVGPDGDAAALTTGQRAMVAVVGFVFYFISFTVMNFFNVALIAAALERFAGRQAGVRVGLALAVKRIPQILAWSAIAATVGVILRAIEERLGLIGRLVIWLVGMAWAIATFFVVPVLAAEGLGPVDALKRSVGVLKKTWGEAALTRIGVGLVFGMATFLVILAAAGAGLGGAIALASPIPLIVAGAIALPIVVGLILVSTTLQTILQAALYRYAVDGTAPRGFQSATLMGMIQPKKPKAG